MKKFIFSFLMILVSFNLPSETTIVLAQTTVSEGPGCDVCNFVEAIQQVEIHSKGGVVISSFDVQSVRFDEGSSNSGASGYFKTSDGEDISFSAELNGAHKFIFINFELLKGSNGSVDFAFDADGTTRGEVCHFALGCTGVGNCALVGNLLPEAKLTFKK